MKLKHVQYTHKSLANHYFFNALVSAAAGLLANWYFFAQKLAWHECKSGRDKKFYGLCCRAPLTVHNSGQILHCVDHLGQAWVSVVQIPELGDVRYSDMATCNKCSKRLSFDCSCALRLNCFYCLAMIF